MEWWKLLLIILGSMCLGALVLYVVLIIYFAYNNPM